jgi:RNA polymerase sigma-70 factor (ECF subfamily)
VKLIRLKPALDTLVERCRKNDSKAQYALYELLSPKMLGVCRRYVKSLEEAEEVLSNGFIKVFNKIEDYRGDGPFEGWVRRIMVHESINYIRYKKNIFVEMQPEWLPEDTHNPITEGFAAEALLQLIDDLPTGYKTVFNLYAIEGYAHKEIGDLLGITESTSKSQLSKARKYLQERINEKQYLYKL